MLVTEPNGEWVNQKARMEWSKHAVFRAERSSKPAEITAGMEEGYCGCETCLYWSFVSSFTGTQVFSRIWSQLHSTGCGCRDQHQGYEGSERGSVSSQSLLCHSLPGSWFLALQLQYSSALSKLLGCSYA